jgi:hypothetical protein
LEHCFYNVLLAESDVIFISRYQFLVLRIAAEVAKACTVQSHMQGMQGNKLSESTENVRELFPAVVNH